MRSTAWLPSASRAQLALLFRRVWLAQVASGVVLAGYLHVRKMVSVFARAGYVRHFWHGMVNVISTLMSLSVAG